MTDPAEEARGAIREALEYLLTVDGYSREDAEAFVDDQIAAILDEQDPPA